MPEQAVSAQSNPFLASPVIPSSELFSETWRETMNAAVNAAFASTRQIAQASTPLAYDPTAPARAFTSFAFALGSNPEKLFKLQLAAANSWAEYFSVQTKRMLNLPVDPLVTEDRSDRRFSDVAWKENPFFAALKDAYLLAAQNMVTAVQEAEGLDDKTRARIDFFIRQYVYAIAPTNFAATNPAVIRKTIETCGLNLPWRVSEFSG